MADEDVILPYAEMVKKAERDGVDIMVYVNSMHAHVLNQRDALARQNKQIATLRAALKGLSDMYARIWDRVDGALVLMPDSIDKFEAAQAKAHELLSALNQLKEPT